MSQVVLGWGFCLFFKWLWFCVFTVFYSLLVLFLVNHQMGGRREAREYIIAACSAPVFHASNLDSFISSGFQNAALDYPNLVGERTKNLFYKSFTNLGTIDILEFWI